MQIYSIPPALMFLCGAVAFSAPTEALAQPAARIGIERDGSHDFDFHFGRWITHISILKDPLSGSHVWTQYDGNSNVRKVWGGRASIFELEAAGPAGHIEGVGLRLYNARTHQWTLNWASSTDGKLENPMIGSFKDGIGQFFDQEFFEGRAIYVRNGFSAITPDSSRFEQAFSDDGGRTWETNWIMTFKSAHIKDN
jgi:hypothetical protein